MAANSKELAKLARQAAGGDKNAFNELYRQTRDKAYFVAFSVTKNEDDALDILQDSYLKAWMKIGSLKNYEVAGAWLNQIVGNTAKDYVKKRRPQLFQPTGEDDDPLAWQSEKDDTYVPDAAMDTAETRRLIMAIVDDLPEDQRLCVLMHYYNDLDLREIAEALEVPYETVKSRLRYAKRKIGDGVHDLERRGMKLYGAAPIPFFVWFLKHALLQSSKALPYIIIGGSITGGGILAALTLPRILAGTAALVIVLGGTIAGIIQLQRRDKQPVTEAGASIFETAAYTRADDDHIHFQPQTTRAPGVTAPESYTSAQTPLPASWVGDPPDSNPGPALSADTVPATAAATSIAATIASHTAAGTATAAKPAAENPAAEKTSTTTITTTTKTTTTTTATKIPVTPYVTVIYNFAHNGGNAASRASASVKQGAAADLTPTAAKPGWAFLGWNTDRNAREGLASLSVGGDTTLYAIFTRQVVAVFHDYAYAGGNPEDYASFSYKGSSRRLWRTANGSANTTAPALREIKGWQALGWSSGEISAGAPSASYILPGETIQITQSTDFYGVYKRGSVHFVSHMPGQNNIY